MPDLPHCPSDEQLQLLAVGKLPNPLAAEFEEHLLACDDCAQRTVELHTEDPLVQALVRGKSSSSFGEHGEEPAARQVAHLIRKIALATADGAELETIIGPSPLPLRIGRYRIEQLLGRGGFGLVYLAFDEQLQRAVAVKVPHSRLVARQEDAEPYLVEARTVASLDHPQIVPVFDVGSTADHPCFIVSKYIEGIDLASQLKDSHLSPPAAAELVAAVAEALHHAHMHGLVHRDIKPGNILLDRTGQPFVVDFGLALREQDLGRGPRYAGTPAYMSPEQARGEGHRVDGRSDIFSLGVVFFELLTGRRPFRAETQQELLEQITRDEVRPPRQIDDTIPKELERICLKALSKRASERYSVAKDFAEDLRLFLSESPESSRSAVTNRQQIESKAQIPALTPAIQPISESLPLRIVPKGLRSYEAADADFFLELLPGPKDREGLPASLRFWKKRIENADVDCSFTVGLMYGPSGCGKSSLVKAGLLPRLNASIEAIYLEATTEETEVRLLKSLQRRFPKLPADLGLVDSCSALRQGHFLRSDQKVLIVIDQFEQWLHARHAEESTELVRALRQCDSRKLQCVIMVRDDFWLAATRFMNALEIEIQEGQNSALVDLFDPMHARKVLVAYGRAYSRLPDSSGQFSADQAAFLDQVIAGIAEDSKVVSVRLALFAEMIKGKPWTPSTLKQVGGTEGVGVAFLEETFHASTAPPLHRMHMKAAQSVLKSLLPEAGTDIKGHLRSREELLRAAGYGQREKEFDALLRILDGEVRLITPTDPEGREDFDSRTVQVDAKYYQLTHDYLVPALRDWLTRKQKETRRGRAELLLEDRAAIWKSRPENRQLPSVLQWFQIETLTSRKHWTASQQQMMRKATRHHALRTCGLAIFIALISWIGYETHGTLKAHALMDRLLDANTADVPAIVTDAAPYRRWITPLLRDALKNSVIDQEPRADLHIRLALLPGDDEQAEQLYRRLLLAEPHEVPVIRAALNPFRASFLDRLWSEVESPASGKGSQRLRAAAALAEYDPQNEKWTRFGPEVVNDLMQENPVFLGLWMEAYRPVKNHLLAPLSNIYRDRQLESAEERTRATNILADYASDLAAVLIDLFLDADEKQFTILFPKVKSLGEQIGAVFAKEVDQSLPDDATIDARDQLANRQANAAVALLDLGQFAKVWPCLKQSPDPSLRSYLIHRLGPCGAAAGVIIEHLEREPDVTIRRALMLSLGEFTEQQLPAIERESLVPKLQEVYRTESDAGLHAATEWLLRQWNQAAWLKSVNEDWSRNNEQRAGMMGRMQDLFVNSPGNVPPQWYVNGQGQTMVAIRGPVVFTMGSRPDELNYQLHRSRQHSQRIGRTFSISNKAVSVEQYRAFHKPYRFGLETSENEVSDAPIVSISWHEAALYCNWLSKEEGLPPDQWCYEADEAGQLVTLSPNYLSLAGYRLPTEAEMEYACRAGAITSRYFGEAENLLPKYGWYFANSQDQTQPVGRLKPNDSGLFDMLGNVSQWCQDGPKDNSPPEDGEIPDDLEEIELTVGASLRSLYGAGIFDRATTLTANNVRQVTSHFRNGDVGFRIASTLVGSIPDATDPSELQVKKPSTLIAAQGKELPPWKLPANSPRPAKEPFSAEEAQQLQQVWADDQHVPVQIENSVGMKFRLIPPADLQIGATDEELAIYCERNSHWWAIHLASKFTTTRRNARLLRPIYFGVTEVTYDQFRKFIDETGYVTLAESRDAGGRSIRTGVGVEGAGPQFHWRTPHLRAPHPNEPVTQVSIQDMQRFCHWLSKKEGAIYRLPTETEWEFSARAGTPPTGLAGPDAQTLADCAWIATSPRPNVSEHYALPVALKKANAFGLYDCLGNVYEACVADQPCRGIGRKPKYANRGCSYDNWPSFVDASIADPNFSNDVADSRTSEKGFRVVREVKPTRN